MAGWRLGKQRIMVRSGKPIRPTPKERAERAAEFNKIGLEAPRQRIDPDRFMKSEHNKALLQSGALDTNPWAGELRRAFIAEQQLRASRFKGRKPGSIGKRRQHVEQLVAKHPGVPAKSLYAVANKKIRGEFPSFSTLVSSARRK